MVLTTDEPYHRLGAGDDPEAYRLRIWQARGKAPVVLLSQLPGGPDPYPVAAKLANGVNRAFLDGGMRHVYVTQTLGPGADSTFRHIRFTAVTKRWMDYPVATVIPRARLEATVGGPVPDRDEGGGG